MTTTDAARSQPKLATIGRGALIDALDRAVEKPVTVITAPPGSGKSFLLRGWQEHAAPTAQIAAISVRRGEKEPQRFWLELMEAIRRALDPSGVDEPLTPSQDFDAESIIDRAVRELAAAEGRVIVVIDDLHELRSTEARGPRGSRRRPDWSWLRAATPIFGFISSDSRGS